MKNTSWNIQPHKITTKTHFFKKNMTYYGASVEWQLLPCLQTKNKYENIPIITLYKYIYGVVVQEC
jgi:hypothetical protein